VRTGLCRESGKALTESPGVLIWAANPNAEFPPSTWKPKKVIDLNYREDSHAKTFALRAGAEYVSGLEMFNRQADEQQKLWSEL
jgi:shikimate 5-dehydrogenase